MAENKLFLGEEEVKGNSPYEPFALNELEKGESVCFYFKETREVNSPEFGEFTVMDGVKFDCNAQTLDELKASMELRSMPANTMLLNKIASGAMRPGNIYRLEKAWNRGDKIPGQNKRAKGHGYNIFKLVASDELIREFEKFIAEKIGVAPAAMQEEKVADAEEPPKPKNKPKI